MRKRQASKEYVDEIGDLLLDRVRFPLTIDFLISLSFAHGKKVRRHCGGIKVKQ